MEPMSLRAVGTALALSLGAGLAGAARAEDGRARIERERSVLEYRGSELGAAEAEAFARLVDDGVADVEALVSPGLPAWAKRTGRIRFVVSSEIDISRTWGHSVVLPLARVRERRAPYLHETVHALVPARGDRTWLSEGLACYLESYVAETRRGYDAHVFTRAGDAGIHAAARRTLASPAGLAVLPWVGAPGEPPRLEEDREGVARPFYVLSQSLAKHVVEAVGLAPLVRALVASDPGAFEAQTGRSDAAWRESWLGTLAARPSPRAGP
jgi:hypothetical protein